METATKVALITGANRGLGLEIARQLGHRHITVVLGVRNQAAGQAAAAQLVAEGIKAVWVAIDVTNAISIAKASEWVNDQFGQLDILVNNAVFYNAEPQLPSQIQADLLQQYVQTNFIGHVLVSQAFLPLLRESIAGRIVNMSTSLGSMSTMGDTTHQNPRIASAAALGYSCSKAALNMFTILLAKELKQTAIKVNSADPGYTQTAMGGKEATYTVEEGAIPAVWLACLDEQGPTGGFFSHKKVNYW